MSERGLARERLHIESIRIGRAPGIDGSFVLSGLSQGITIIHGPNGSGKSTTARSIHSLLWPEPPDDACLVEATISYAGRRWTIHRDGRSVRCRRDGLDHSPLSFDHLTPDTRDRYHLALHDLLRADDAQFAAYVTREASGGYDLETAAAQLRFNATPTSPAHLARSLREAKSAYQQSIQKQQELAGQESTLAALEAESERAGTARLAILELNDVADALAAQAELHDAITAFHARFDTGMAHVAADHGGLLARWRTDEPHLHARLAEIEATLDRERRRMAHTGLPADQDCAKAVRILEAQYTELCEAESARRHADIALATAREHLSALHARIAPHLPEVLQTEQALEVLREYCEALDRLESAARIGEAETRLATWIPRPEPTPEPERLREALGILGAWLQTPPPPQADPALGTARLAALSAALLVIAQGVLLGMEWHPAGYGLAAVGMLVVLWVSLTGRGTVHVDDRPDLEEDYRRLGLDAPAAWSSESVSELFAQTVHAYMLARAAQQELGLWRSITPDLEQRHTALTEANAQKTGLEAKLGVALRLDRSALATITSALDDWLKASLEASRLERNRSLLVDAEQSGLAAFNQTAASLAADAAANGQEAKAVLGAVQDRHEQLKQAQRAIEQATGDRDNQVLPALRRIEQERSALIERYGGRSVPEIEALNGQFDAYRDTQQLIRTRRDAFRSRCDRLGDGVRLSEWTPERVQLALAEQEAIAQQAAEVNQRIGAIKQSIQEAKSRDDVAAALERVERAREDLRERRDAHLQQLVGRLVLDQVRRETREANLPAVARRARELFAEITHGRCQLNFNPGPPPSFTATDTTTGSEHALDQLSSGTRVQLLIAVRTAFVEQNEPDAALPMIFDETLANADAARAEALITTTFRLCADGRQVLYFTAQLDEVERWRHLAAQHGTSVTVIDLAEARRLDAASRPALLNLPTFERPAFPAPNGASRSEYRRVLGAPPLNLWSEDGGDIHLWHLVDDLDALHHLVVDKNVSYWGQVQQLAVHGAAPALGLDWAQFARLAARAEACAALIEAARIGRGKPVSSLVLRASGGMTDRYADRCLTLLETCGGDGQRFLDRLEDRAIGGFRKENIDRFREYFEANGHITAETPLPPDEIRIRVLRRMGEAISAGLIDVATIDRLMREAFVSTDASDEARGEPAGVLSAPD